MHTVQTAGLALATDLTAEESQPKVVGLMYVMLLAGTMVSAVVFGQLLADFSPGRLVQVIQGAALTTMVLNVIALWKQETRRPPRGAAPKQHRGFRESWHAFIEHGHAVRRLVAIGLGTMAFGMQDVLLEPYGGQVLAMSVGSTTSLTATLAFGGLLGFGWASGVLSRGADPFRMAAGGALVGIPAFMAVLAAAPLGSVTMFAAGVLGIGLGGGIFSHGTLTATMNSAPKEQAGLALGAWGAVQATAAGVAVALGGVLRDVISALAGQGFFGPALARPGHRLCFCLRPRVAAARRHRGGDVGADRQRPPRVRSPVQPRIQEGVRHEDPLSAVHPLGAVGRVLAVGPVHPLEPRRTEPEEVVRTLASRSAAHPDHDAAEERTVGRHQHGQQDAADLHPDVVAGHRAGSRGGQLQHLHHAVRFRGSGACVHRGLSLWHHFTRGMRNGSISLVVPATRRGIDRVSCTDCTRWPSSADSSSDRV